MDSAASVYVDPGRVEIVTPTDFAMPPEGLQIRWPDTPLQQEMRLHKYKAYAALAWELPRTPVEASCLLLQLRRSLGNTLEAAGVSASGLRGAFRIEDIPPGAYRVTMWHQGFRRRGIDRTGRLVYEEPHTITKEVAIAPRATATVAFELR